MSGKKQINISIECGGKSAFEIAKGVREWLKAAREYGGPIEMRFVHKITKDSLLMCDINDGRDIESFDISVLSVPMVSGNYNGECDHNCDYGQDKFIPACDHEQGYWERYCCLFNRQLKNTGSPTFPRADECKEFYGGKPCQHRQEINGQ